MYSIVEEQTNSFNGLGGNGNFTNFLQNGGMELINAGLNTATSIVNNAVNAKNNQNPNTGGTTYSPTVYVPPTTGGNTTNAPTTQSKSIGDYLPWIVGGIALLGVGYMILKK